MTDYFEFINEVYREKILLKDLYIRDKDFSNFFKVKEQKLKKLHLGQNILLKN